jgi:hypothetical protein
MLFISLFSWWYTTGWAQLAQRAVLRIASVLDFFSVGLLLKSLFSSYRQISTGRVRGSLDAQFRAWGDRQLSRAIGAMVRLVVILFGLVATILMSVVSLGLLILWPFVPVVPIIVTVLMVGVRG